MVSAICLVNNTSTSNGVNVSAGSTITISLSDVAGITQWSITCTSTDELNTVAAVNATISINLTNFTATCVVPSTTTGSALQFTSYVNNDKTTSVVFGVFVLGPMSNRLLFPGETNESSAQFGVVKDLNTVGRITPGSAPTATASSPGTIYLAGDLGGLYTSPIVEKINGTTVPASPTANTVLTATSSTTSAWQQIADAEVSSSAAIAGTKISPNFGSQAVTGSAFINSAANPSTTGVLRASNNTTVVAARDAANANDVPLLAYTAADNFNIGNTNLSNTFIRAKNQASINIGGQVPLSLADNGAAIMLATLAGLQLGIKQTAANYTIDSGGSADTLIFVDCTSNTVTLTLPVPTAGRTIIIVDQKGQSAVHTIQINQHASETISGSTSKQITVAYNIMVLISDGTNWNEFKVGP